MTVAADKTLVVLDWTVQTVKTTTVKRYKGWSIRTRCDQLTLWGTSSKRQGSRKLGDMRLTILGRFENRYKYPSEASNTESKAKSRRLHLECGFRSYLKETAELISILENCLLLAESLLQTANRGSSGWNSSSQSPSRTVDCPLCRTHLQRVPRHQILPARRNCDAPTLSDLQQHRLPESVLNSICIVGLFKFVAGVIKTYWRGPQEPTDASSITEFDSTRK
jgi:hypothetical protein